MLGDLPSSMPPPPPTPVRVGGAITAPAIITKVEPEYPAIARAAQLEGIVVLEASVDQTGRVDDVKVLRSAGLLDSAAVDAVKRWRYSPLKLNGTATPFVLTVTLQFHFKNGQVAGAA
jgi:protein TonB